MNNDLIEKLIEKLDLNKDEKIEHYKNILAEYENLHTSFFDRYSDYQCMICHGYNYYNEYADEPKYNCQECHALLCYKCQVILKYCYVCKKYWDRCECLNPCQCKECFHGDGKVCQELWCGCGHYENDPHTGPYRNQKCETCKNITKFKVNASGTLQCGECDGIDIVPMEDSFDELICCSICAQYSDNILRTNSK